MNLMDRIERIDRPPAQLREQYLDSLAHPQEMFLENLVASGTAWQLDVDAYAVVNGETLVELFVAADDSDRLLALFEKVMAASAAKAVLCKSYDTQLLFAAFSRSVRVTTGGLMFRKLSDPAFRPRGDVSFRPGVVDDAEAIADFDDGFFDDVEETREFARSGHLVVLESADELIGCGTAKPVIAERDDIDLGMLVAPAHRRRGYGSHIIQYLKSQCLQKGLRPICGCSVENVGSQRALTNAGFVCEHRLLLIEKMVAEPPARRRRTHTMTAAMVVSARPSPSSEVSVLRA